MNVLKIFFCTLLPLLFTSPGKAENNLNQKMIEELTQCRLESSQLIRLDCYDKIALSSTSSSNALPDVTQMGKTWR
ncbi:TPA: hypothetical protein ACSQLI_003751 [Proteus mirabilis]